MIGASAKMGEMTIADVSETHELRYADPLLPPPRCHHGMGQRAS